MAKDMYVLKLTFSEYRDFAQWLTSTDAGGTRRYKLPPGQLNGEIETKLTNYPAKVYEECDPTKASRNFGGQDKVVTHRDQRAAAGNTTNMSMPDQICVDSSGNIDLEYLKGYVRDIKNEPSEEDAAWSLLGMYFLSRCR